MELENKKKIQIELISLDVPYIITEDNDILIINRCIESSLNEILKICTNLNVRYIIHNGLLIF